jgi:hypothetical protein
MKWFIVFGKLAYNSLTFKKSYSSISIKSVKRMKKCSKISKYTFVFAKLRHIMCFTLLKRLYYALVHSNIVYLLPIWGNAPQTYLNCLQTLQNKIVKIIKFLPFDSPTDSLYSTDFLSIKQQFKYESILLIYRMSHGLLKSGFQFVTNFAVTGRITRSSTNLRLPHFLTASAQNTIFYKGLDLYNALPPQLKSSLIAYFKRGLKLYILAWSQIMYQTLAW